MMFKENSFTRMARAGLIWVACFFCSVYAMGQNYPAVFDKNTINGSNGFVIHGLETNYKLGNEVRFIGDVNHDGYEDIAVGNGNQEVGGFELAGRAYIIFGGPGSFPSPFDLNSLDGTNGFMVESVGYDERRGSTIAGPGDINGDGIDDLIIGSSNRFADEIVIYGATSFPAKITVNDIDGTNGFLIDTPGSNQVDALGDVNGDNINDFIIGTPHFSGQAWVVFGRTNNFPATVDVTYIDGIRGFRTSSFEGSRPSYKVGGAGDINNDGLNDMLLGNWASSYDVDGEISYALFGKDTPFDAVVDVEAVDGSDGFVIDNRDNSFLTFVGTLEDINGDGIDDCYSENNVIFGSDNPFPASILMSDLNGTNGFVMQNYVLCAAPAGDLNMDGIGDFIVVSSDPYVVYGSSYAFPAMLDPATLDGENGFNIENVGYSNIGRPVAGGRDFNGDGLDDFLFGDNSASATGGVYVVFGGDHYALPMNGGYPQATDETMSGFTLLVNGQEKGTIHYAVFNNGMPVVSDHNVISTGAGAVVNGNFALDAINTEIAALVNGLTPGTTYDVYLYLEDASGNEGEIYTLNDVTTLSFTDTEPPTITCPSDQLLGCNETLPDYTGLAAASDNADPLPVITQSPLAGAAFTPGMVVTLTATDDSGNQQACTFTVSEEPDTQAPAVTCPGTQNVDAGDVLPDYTPLASASDNCDASPVITQSPSPGSAVTAGMTVTINVADASGNTNSCTFTVGINPDTEAPTITCPSDQLLGCNEVLPDYTALAAASDNADPSPDITQTPLAGTAFTPGMAVTLMATDDSGNHQTCTFTVEEQPDTQAPGIICPANQTVDIGEVLPDYTSLVVVSDNCDVSPVTVQSPLAGTAVTAGMTVTFEATDVSGNIGFCSFTVDLNTDTEAPAISCPADQSLGCNDALPDYTGHASVSDNLDPNPDIIQSPAPGTSFTAGMTVTLTAMDDSGNSSVCSFQVNEYSVENLDAGDDLEIVNGDSVALSPSVKNTGSGQFLWEPSIGLSRNDVANPIAFPDKTTTYTLTYTNEHGCVGQDEITIVVAEAPEREYGIVKKYGISPDNDGFNDVWILDGIEQYPDNKVSIFNRWGNLVFQMDGYNNTSRVFNGQANRLSSLGSGQLPEGTYFFKLQLSGDEDELKGFIVIKR